MSRLEKAEAALRAIADIHGVIEMRGEDLARVLGVRTTRGARLIIAELGSTHPPRLTRSGERGRGVPMRLVLAEKAERETRKQADDTRKKAEREEGREVGHGHASPSVVNQEKSSSCSLCEVRERVLRALLYPEGTTRNEKREREVRDVKPEAHAVRATPATTRTPGKPRIATDEEEEIALNERDAQLIESGKRPMDSPLRHIMVTQDLTSRKTLNGYLRDAKRRAEREAKAAEKDTAARLKSESAAAFVAQENKRLEEEAIRTKQAAQLAAGASGGKSFAARLGLSLGANGSHPAHAQAATATSPPPERPREERRMFDGDENEVGSAHD